MRVTKNYLDKTVSINWVDPRTSGERLDIKDAPKGKAALAKWEEFGIIDDLTDGVVRLRYAHAWDANGTEPDEAIYTWIPEELITGIAILQPTKEEIE